ncbi:MAG: glycosyltransferase family 61 protein [Pseudomonadota bacterium]
MSLRCRLKPVVAPVVRRINAAPVPEAEILQPEETEPAQPVTLLPNMLDRVTGTDEHSQLAAQLQAMQAKQAIHAPVLRRIYRNALVRRGGFATWRHNESYKGRLLQGLGRPLIKVPELRYCHSYVSWRYFGHWLTDSVPSAFIEAEQGALWMPPHPDWADAAAYLQALDLAPLTAPLVLAERLIVYQDYGQGSHKRHRYEVIRKKLQSVFGAGEPMEYVYLRRGQTGVSRTIANEEVLIDALVARGWTILDITGTTVAERQAVLCRARVVVSIDGSHIDHAHLSLSSGAVMVVLMPGDRFSVRQNGLCHAHGVSLGMVVLNGDQTEGYHVEIDEVLRTVDLAGAESRR